MKKILLIVLLLSFGWSQDGITGIWVDANGYEYGIRTYDGVGAMGGGRYGEADMYHHQGGLKKGDYYKHYTTSGNLNTPAQYVKVKSKYNAIIYKVNNLDTGEKRYSVLLLFDDRGWLWKYDFYKAIHIYRINYNNIPDLLEGKIVPKGLELSKVE